MSSKTSGSFSPRRTGEKNKNLEIKVNHTRVSKLEKRGDDQTVCRRSNLRADLDSPRQTKLENENREASVE